MAAKGADLAPSGSYGFPTWARLITEQWLLLRSQNGSFTFMSVCPGPMVFAYLKITIYRWMAAYYFKVIGGSPVTETPVGSRTDVQKMY